jgi:hypothetical protein
MTPTRPPEGTRHGVTPRRRLTQQERATRALRRSRLTRGALVAMGYPPKTRCGATARTTGKPCRRWALVAQARCRLHGGATPGALRAAEQRMQEAYGLASAIRLGLMQR